MKGPLRFITVIPARGGSIGVRDKNLQVVGGLPLVAGAVRLARAVGSARVIVDTDSEEIAATARIHGAESHRREARLAGPDVTLDELVERTFFPNHSALLMLQPTVVGLSVEGLRSWIRGVANTETPTAMGVETRHIVWSDTWTMVGRRANRQHLEWPLTETGVRWYPAGSTVGAPGRVALYRGGGPLIDIDTVDDLHAARAIRGRRTVRFVVRVGPRTGSGHLRRSLVLAAGTQHHDVLFTLIGDPGSEHAPPGWAVDTLTAHGWANDPRSPGQPLRADLTVFDVLDTELEWVAEQQRWGGRVVTLEDQGPGARVADLVINSMYPAPGAENQVTGPRWEVLHPSFVGVPFKPHPSTPPSVLVTFGGTDPARLTERAAEALPHSTVIWPPGRPYVDDPPISPTRLVVNPSMPERLGSADLVVTSGGRTIFEALALGTPCVVLAQNTRELTHSQIGTPGVVSLGLGHLVRPEDLASTVESLTGASALADLTEAAHRSGIDGAGSARIVREIDRLLSERT